MCQNISTTSVKLLNLVLIDHHPIKEGCWRVNQILEDQVKLRTGCQSFTGWHTAYDIMTSYRTFNVVKSLDFVRNRSTVKVHSGRNFIMWHSSKTVLSGSVAARPECLPANKQMTKQSPKVALCASSDCACRSRLINSNNMATLLLEGITAPPQSTQLILWSLFVL